KERRGSSQEGAPDVSRLLWTGSTAEHALDELELRSCRHRTGSDARRAVGAAATQSGGIRPCDPDRSGPVHHAVLRPDRCAVFRPCGASRRVDRRPCAAAGAGVSIFRALAPAAAGSRRFACSDRLVVARAPVYAFAIHSAPAYWVMQLSLAGSAVAVWRRAFGPETGPGPSLLALLAVLVQMGMLGALLAFARDALYVPHFHTTATFRLTPIQDRQRGGVIMSVPASVPYLLAAAVILARHLERAGAQAQSS